MAVPPNNSDAAQVLEAREAKLREQLAQVRAKKAQLEARKVQKLIKGQRADDTRRKILVGATVLAKVERGEWPQDKLNALLDASLTRNDDRALFGLPAKPQQAAG